MNNISSQLVSAYQPNAQTPVALTARPSRQDNALTNAAGGPRETVATAGQPELRKVFDDFVGQTFYSQMLSAMRKTVDKPAYFHGGHAEEAFQNQLDQTLAEHLADATAEQFSGPMFELFNMSRR